MINTSYQCDICNNLIEGFTGGYVVNQGVSTRTRDNGILANNSYYNCSSSFNYTSEVICYEGNESLGSTPFAKSGSITFANRETYFAPQDVGSVLVGHSIQIETVGQCKGQEVVVVGLSYKAYWWWRYELMERQQSTNTYPILFLMVSTSDGVTPVTGITPTVTVSKNGGSYASASSTVTEIANGVYSLSGAGLATDLNTLGTAAFHATGTGAHPREFMVDVVANNPFAATVVVGTNNDKTDYELTTTERAAIGAAFLATEITKGDPGTIERAFGKH